MDEEQERRLRRQVVRLGLQGVSDRRIQRRVLLTPQSVMDSQMAEAV